MSLSPTAVSVLKYWFTEHPLEPKDIPRHMARWFTADADVDYDIERRFGKLVSLAAQGSFNSWSKNPQECLALIILLDQFPRNLHREKPVSFNSDTAALKLAKHILQENALAELSPIEAAFALMPFQHAENLDDQNKGVLAYEQLMDSHSEQWRPALENFLFFARRHQGIIEKFGRFPHRNKILQRASTPEEFAYLENTRNHL